MKACQKINLILKKKKMLLTCHNIQPYTNAIDIKTCTVNQITMFMACVRSNNSLPFLIHNIASDTIMAP